MNRIFTFLLTVVLILFTNFNSYAKSYNKFLTYAYKNAQIHTDYSSSMKFEVKDRVTLAKWAKWIKKCNHEEPVSLIRNDYNNQLVPILSAGISALMQVGVGKQSSNDKVSIYTKNDMLKLKTQTVWLYGAPQTFVIEVGFLKTGNVQAYVNYYDSIATVKKARRETVNMLIGTIVLGGGLYVIDKIFNSSKSNITNSNSLDFISCENETANPVDLYVLSIGTDQNVLANNDAIAISSRLKQGCGQSDLFGNVYTKTLTLSDASRSNILEAFDEMSKRTNEDDLFLIFFSGHGGINNSNFVFQTFEKETITIEELINGLNADRSKAILWFDACWAGQVKNDFRNKVDDYIRNKQCPNVSILMSSSDDESSWLDDVSRKGFFTQAILDGLNGAADRNNNRIVSLDELEEFVVNTVSERTGRCTYCENIQHPQKLKAGREEFETRLSKY